jgi:ribosome-associated protein
MQAEALKSIVLDALEEIKASDIVVLDVRKLTPLFDYMVVASAESGRQTKALARNVHDRVKAAGGEVLGSEGEESGEWVLVDLGDMVVHIMQPAVRNYYNLEQLWGGEAPRRVVPLRRSNEPWSPEQGDQPRP